MRRAVELIWVWSLRNCRSPNSSKVYSKTSERLSNAIGVHWMRKFMYLVVHETLHLIHRYGLTSHSLCVASFQNSLQCFVCFHIAAFLMFYRCKVKHFPWIGKENSVLFIRLNRGDRYLIRNHVPVPAMFQSHGLGRCRHKQKVSFSYITRDRHGPQRLRPMPFLYGAILLQVKKVGLSCLISVELFVI